MEDIKIDFIGSQLENRNEDSEWVPREKNPIKFGASPHPVRLALIVTLKSIGKRTVRPTLQRVEVYCEMTAFCGQKAER